MANDKFGKRGSGAILRHERVMRRRSKREQRAFAADAIIEQRYATLRDDKARGRTAEETTHLAIARGAGHEDSITHLTLSPRGSLDDATNRFVTRHEWIPHAGKRRHSA